MFVPLLLNDIFGRNAFLLRDQCLADEFAALDRFVIEDDYVETIGISTCLNKLYECGICHIGELIQLSEHDLRVALRLSPGEIQRIKAALARSGLHLETDAQAWQEYRFWVPKLGRLKRIGPSLPRCPADYQVI